MNERVPGFERRVGKPLGQTEVGDMRFIVRIEEDIGGLEIAVEDALFVGVVNGTGDLLHATCGRQ